MSTNVRADSRSLDVGPASDAELGADRDRSEKNSSGKPFHYPELLARVATVLRRRSGRRQGPIRVGELSGDPVTRRVRVDAREVQLANKEFVG